MYTEMIVPKIGVSIMKDDDAELIYQQFSEYFTVSQEYGSFTLYTIIKKPSQQLKDAMDVYFKKDRAKERAREKFIYKTAQDVITQLSEEDKTFLFRNPDAKNRIKQW